tara:strand:- start:156 stop:368 length:213 start_codon:yes stop_codon:yes gene_type:complete
LAYVEGDGARAILVKNTSRFVQDLTIQLTRHSMLKELGYELIPVYAPSHFLDDTPPAVITYSILRAVLQF